MIRAVRPVIVFGLSLAIFGAPACRGAAGPRGLRPCALRAIHARRLRSAGRHEPGARVGAHQSRAGALEAHRPLDRTAGAHPVSLPAAKAAAPARIRRQHAAPRRGRFGSGPEEASEAQSCQKAAVTPRNPRPAMVPHPQRRLPRPPSLRHRRSRDPKTPTARQCPIPGTNFSTLCPAALFPSRRTAPALCPETSGLMSQRCRSWRATRRGLQFPLESRLPIPADPARRS